MSFTERLFGPSVTPALLFASFCGGAAAAVVLKVKDPRQICAILFVGLVCSIYIGPLMSHQVSAWFDADSSENVRTATGFICGMSGMIIANAILAVMGRLTRLWGEPKA